MAVQGSGVAVHQAGLQAVDDLRDVAAVDYIETRDDNVALRKVGKGWLMGYYYIMTSFFLSFILYWVYRPIPPKGAL